MSLTLNTLRNKKKNELKEIAQDLGLSTNGLRNELESRIKTHLGLKNPELLLENEAPPRRSGRQRNLNNTNTRSKHSTNGDRSSSDDESSKSIESEIKQEMIISETIRSVTEIEEINVAETSSQQENQENQEISHIVGQPITTNLSFPLNVEKIKSYIPKLRTNLSNPQAFLQIIFFIEFLVFIYHAIEWNYEITTISIPSLFDERTNSYGLYAPDITFFIDWHRFWRPLICLFFYLLLLPLGISFIINFEPQHHTYSPLVFSVAKYGIFLISNGNFDWVEDIHEFVPDNLIYTGAGAGVILSFYETILRK